MCGSMAVRVAPFPPTALLGSPFPPLPPCPLRGGVGLILWGETGCNRCPSLCSVRSVALLIPLCTCPLFRPTEKEKNKRNSLHSSGSTATYTNWKYKSEDFCSSLFFVLQIHFLFLQCRFVAVSNRSVNF